MPQIQLEVAGGMVGCVQAASIYRKDCGYAAYLVEAKGLPGMGLQDNDIKMNTLNIGWLKQEISRLPLPMQVVFIDALLKHGGTSAVKYGSLSALQESLYDFAESRDSSKLPGLVIAFWDHPQDVLAEVFLKLDTQAFTEDLESVHSEILERFGFYLS